MKELEISAGKGRFRDGVPAGAWALRGLVALGLAATVYYFSWWGEAGRITSPLLALALVGAGAYHWTQLLGSWFIYLSARKREEPPPPSAVKDLTVDVFVTVCNEPRELVLRALEGVVAMRGKHRSWLLDDGGDPELADLAARMGVGYLTRDDHVGAKAGNINAALARTDGDIIVIFDLDHAPTPDFLERTLGHFEDPAVGFVQVMLSFENQEQSWIARAARETTLDFFNPVSTGMDRLGSATLIGSNALIRREALVSIGGYRHGLAEDLATSIELHADGWKSVYVAEPLAPGLAPADTRAWFTQQLKWARGVFEVLLTAFPRLWPRLDWRQRMSYAVRMTYYWIGPVAIIHMGFTIGVLLAGEKLARVDLRQYIVHALPLVVVAFAVKLTALACWRHPSVGMTPQWRATVLVYATWPVYTLAWVMAALRLPLDFRLTPKSFAARAQWNWLAPQMLASTLIAVAMVFGLTGAQTSHVDVLLVFCLLQATPQIVLLWQSAKTTA
jgi:cellulose synthase (UDP-forming)